MKRFHEKNATTTLTLTAGAPALVRRDDDRLLALVALGDDLEEEGRLGPLQRRVADLVELCVAPHKSTYVQFLVMWRSPEKPASGLPSGYSDST